MWWQCVVYFDQQTGASYTLLWSKSSLIVFRQVFQSFSVRNGKRRKSIKNNEKIYIGKILTHIICSNRYFFVCTLSLFLFLMEKDRKTCENAKKMILTSEWHAKHLFAGQYTPQKWLGKILTQKVTFNMRQIKSKLTGKHTQ